MTTSNSDPLGGDVKGFLVFPTAWAKPRDGEEHADLTLRELRHLRRASRRHRDEPLPFQLPQRLTPTLFASHYDQPDPLEAEEAAARLFRRPQHDFMTMLDQTARRYAGLPQFDPHQHFTHMHAIGSWENALEPSLVTVFHKPISDLDLRKIGAEMGVWAKQHGILAFSPHPEGTEKLMRMQLKTHDPVTRLTPQKIANIVRPITDAFNAYHDQHNDKINYWMPGRSIIPNPNGTTDVLVWLPPWDTHPEATQKAFMDVSNHFTNAMPPTFWTGTGHMLGGTSPFSDDEAEYMSDKEKREAAIANYQRVLGEDAGDSSPSSLAGRFAVPTDASKFGRTGRPLKFSSPQDVQDLFRGITKKPHDRARWLIAADALDETDKPATASTFRKIAEHGKVFDSRLGWGSLIVEPHNELATAYDDMVRPPTQAQSNLNTGIHYVLGNIHGIPVTVSSFSRSPEHSVSGYHIHFGDMYEGSVAVPITHAHELLKELEVNNVEPTFQNSLNSLMALIKTRQGVLRRNLLQRSQNALRRHRPNQEPEQFARAPAKTGAVVRGVFYAPGKMLPDIETPPPKLTLQELIARRRRKTPSKTQS